MHLAFVAYLRDDSLLHAKLLGDRSKVVGQLLDQLLLSGMMPLDDVL